MSERFSSLVVNIFEEEVDKFVPFFLLILNKPRGRSFAKELHKSALHHDPEHSGQVEEESEEDEVEWDPLVVGVVHNGGGVHILVAPRAGPLVLPGNVPCGIHPAVGLQHLLLNTLLS